MKLLYIGQQKPMKDGIAHHNTSYIQSLSQTTNIEITCMHNQRTLERIKGVKYVKFNPFKYKSQIRTFDIIHFQFGASYKGDFVNLCFMLTPKNHKTISTIHDFSNFNISRYYRILKEDLMALPYSLFFCSIKKILKHSDKIIVYSDFFRRILLSNQRASGEKIISVKMGVPVKITSAYKRKDDIFRICSFGSITPRKGYEEPIEAVSKLAEEKNPVEYDIYGYTPFKFYIDNLKKRFDSKSIHFKGDLADENILDTLSKYDLIVIPRKYTNEGASGSLTFAIGSLTPIITVSIGSFKEYIIKNKTGFIIEHKVREYYLKIKQAISKPAIMNKMRQNTIEHIKRNLTWRAVCKEHDKIYKEIMEK